MRVILSILAAALIASPCAAQTRSVAGSMADPIVSHPLGEKANMSSGSAADAAPPEFDIRTTEGRWACERHWFGRTYDRRLETARLHHDPCGRKAR